MPVDLVSNQTGVTIGIVTSLLVFAVAVGKFWSFITSTFAAWERWRERSKDTEKVAKAERKDLDGRLKSVELDVDRLKRPGGEA